MLWSLGSCWPNWNYRYNAQAITIIILKQRAFLFLHNGVTNTAIVKIESTGWKDSMAVTVHWCSQVCNQKSESVSCTAHAPSGQSVQSLVSLLPRTFPRHIHSPVVCSVISFCGAKIVSHQETYHLGVHSCWAVDFPHTAQLRALLYYTSEMYTL